MVLNKFRSTNNDIRRDADSYIDDIFANNDVMQNDDVIQLLKSFGLVWKELGKLDGGRIVG